MSHSMANQKSQKSNLKTNQKKKKVIYHDMVFSCIKF